MSGILTEAVFRVPDLDPYERAVLGYLAHRTPRSAKGHVSDWYVPQKEIARDLGIARETVSRIIARLREKGLVKVTGRTKLDVLYYRVLLLPWVSPKHGGTWDPVIQNHNPTHPVIEDHSPGDSGSHPLCATITTPVILDHIEQGESNGKATNNQAASTPEKKEKPNEGQQGGVKGESAATGPVQPKKLTLADFLAEVQSAVDEGLIPAAELEQVYQHVKPENVERARWGLSGRLKREREERKVAGG